MFLALQFKSLSKDLPWVKNAKIPLPNGLIVSVSYGHGLWFVGGIGSYEVAVMRENDLLLLPDLIGTSTVIDGVGEEQLEKIVAAVGNLQFKPADIYVFDTQDENPPTWHKRFSAIEGEDFKQKLIYAKRIWGDKIYVVRRGLC